MSDRLCLVHYHEIGLKGKNRSTFEKQLVTNLNRALRGTGISRIARISGYIVVETEDRNATPELAARIAQVPGVARVSLAYRCNLDEREYCRAAVNVMREAGDFSSFKVHARRSSTAYPVHTLEMNQIVGEVLCEAFPEKKVVTVTGDGGLLMVVQELATAVAENLPVVICLINNGWLGMVRQWQKLFWNKRYSATKLYDSNPDFVKLAEAYGIAGYRATNQDEFEEALQSALDSGKAAVIDCMLDIDEMVHPMVNGGSPVTKFLLD